MPALELCGQKTVVAGDDLQIFCFFAVGLRVVQLCLLIPLTIYVAGRLPNSGYCSQSDDFEDRAEILMLVYSSVATCLVMLFLVVDILM